LNTVIFSIAGRAAYTDVLDLVEMKDPGIMQGGFDYLADLHVELEDEIRNRLYFPGETRGFPSGRNPDRHPPSWARDFDLGFQDNRLTASFFGTDLGTFPLFTNSPF